jgi:hypothetical protein
VTTRNELAAIAARLADIGLAIVGVIALSALISVVYYYGWTGQRQFSSSSYAILYYGCPSALLVLLLASSRLPPTHRINLLIVFVAVAGSVTAFELFTESKYFSLYASTRPVMDSLLAASPDKDREASELARQWGVEIDARTASEVIASLRQHGVDAVPIITASNQLFLEQPDGGVRSAVTIDGREIMPLAGVSNKVTVLCNENGQWIDYQSDEHGFNNPPEIWHLAHLEIAALGDSFTHGYCVPREKSFVPLIRQRYPATLNLGVSGDGPLLMLATLKEYLPAFGPKIVLWFYYEGNDLTDLQRERKSALLRNYLSDGFTQSGLVHQRDIDQAMMNQVPRLTALLEEENRARKRNRVVGTLRDVTTLAALRQRLGLIGGTDADQTERAADLQGPNMNTFREILVQAKASVDAWGGQIDFIYLPEWARYTSNTSWGKANRDEVLTIVRDVGIPLVDLDPTFQVHGDPLSLFPFRRAGHYNEVGHRLVAEAVLKAVQGQLGR